MPEQPAGERDTKARSRWPKVRVGTVLKIAAPVVVVGGFIGYRLLVPVPVVVHRVEQAELSIEVFGRGTVESRREADLSFDLVGRISDVLVDEGDRVELGQELAHLAPEQVEAELQTARSGVDATRSSLRRIDADERSALDTLEFAQSEEARMRELAASGAAAYRDLDIAAQQTRLARAELARARAARIEVRRAVAVATGTVEQRRVLALRSALVAPFDGLVVRRLRDPGDTVAVASTVLRVVATDRLWVRAWIDESVLGQLAEQQPARVQFPGDPDAADGTVDRIGREADRQTHEILVDVALESVPDRVAIGQRADVLIETQTLEDVVAIPLQFMMRDGAHAYAYVDEDGRIERRALELGAVGRDAVEVTSGLLAGDLLLRAPLAGAALPEGRRYRAEELP